MFGTKVKLPALSRAAVFSAMVVLTAAALGLLPGALFAQGTGTISGNVTDVKSKEALPGAQVLVKGTNRGAASDVNGAYVIRSMAPGTYTVEARFIGYATQEATVTVVAGQQATVDFQLKQSLLQLGEVIVTGQGAAVEKRQLPTAVSTLSVQEIELAPVKSVDQLLQGRVPGLLSALPTGMPGTGARIQTRGLKSVVTNSTPVIYVDGVRVDNGDNFRLAFGTGGQVSSSLADLVTGEIDRVEVIKGGASSTLYGSEAANGVVQIFTKKGIPGQARWRFNVTSGGDTPENKFTYEQFTKDLFYRNSTYQAYTAGVSGGTETFSYNVSGKMYDNRGMVVQDKLFDKQYNLATGMRAIMSPNADIEFSASYTRSQFGTLFNDNSTSAPLSALELEANFRLAQRNKQNLDSLLNLYLLPDLSEVANRFITSVNVNYSPHARFKNRFTVGLDSRKNEARHFAPIESPTSIFGTAGGFLRVSFRDYLTVTMNYTGSYLAPKIGPVSQTISAGVQGFRVEDRENFGSGSTFRIPGTTDFGNASVIAADESNRQLFNGGFFVTDQIGLYDRLYFDLGVRFDGNSAFGKEVGIQTYPKAGVAYNVSDENFYPNFLKPYVGTLKLRAAIGQTGNFPSPFVRDRSYVSNSFLSEAAVNFGNPGDPKLAPEKTTSIDYGLDAGIWDDRVSLEFSVFNQKTKDALFNVLTDPASGFGAQQRNVGEIENKGLEASLRANVLTWDNLELDARVSFATLSNKVVSLGNSPPFSIAGFAFAPQRVEEGHPVGVYQVNVPVPDADGVFRGAVTIERRGNPTPKQTGSIALDLKVLKKISVYGLAEFARGHYVLNQLLSRHIVRSQSGDIVYPEDYAKVPGELNPTTNRKPYDRNTASAILLEKGDWFKIREVSLRYQLPRVIGVNSLALNASVRNLAILGTKTWFVDPELSFIRAGGNLEVGGIVGANPSPPKQFRFGVDVSL
jgi:outer membrane receptor protein involved in Fe transport